MPLFVPTKKKLNLSTYVPEADIVHYVRTKKLTRAVVDEKGNVDPDDFTEEEVVVESERVNRTDFINSFREDVGIENILKKVALSGDVSLLNQVKRPDVPLAEDGKHEMIQDATLLQEGEGKIAEVGEEMRKAYAAMPEELTKGRGIEKFLNEVDRSEIEAFAKAYIAAKQAAGGVNDGE